MTIIERLSADIKERIEAKLFEEECLVEKAYEGETVRNDYDEIVYVLASEIFNDYSQIPLVELSELINEQYPFVSELGITIVPNMEIEYDDSSQVRRVYVSGFFIMENYSKLSDDQKYDLNDLFIELQEVYDDLGISVRVYFEEIISEEDTDCEEVENQDNETRLEIDWIKFGR
ncbi:hypothetical protein [Neobacillus drentensis]|uniref:hypothetical protein n=1 Tax=Neobacillus drentensis TaxID=220684 RepID=UPI003000829F